MDQFTSFDGVEIAYQEWRPTGESGLPPVVVHHGFIADATVNWVRPGVVDALVAAGRRVIAPDARGHGASGKPTDPAAYGEATMARDLAALLDHAGTGPVDLVGYSMGAVVATIFTLRDPRVRRLVIGGIGASLAELGGVDTRLAPTAVVAAVLRTDDPAEVAASPATAFRLLADAVGADRRALAAQIEVVHAEPLPLETIVAPVLVLCGADDPLAARPHVLAGAIPGARLEIVDGDHLAAVGNPAFAAAVVDFLDS